MILSLGRALGIGLALAAIVIGGGAARAASGAPHTFILTYRDFGPVIATSDFEKAQGYELRFEGCFAKQSEEAVCGFTLRTDHLLTITNVENLSHGADAGGSPIRTCCMFVQGDNRGYPILRASSPPADIAVLVHSLRAGDQVGLMLRVPDYRKAGRFSAVTFSRGQGDVGVTFPAQITELPQRLR